MNFHAPVVHRSFTTALSEHYAAVRARLGGLPAVRSAEIPAAPVLKLPPPEPCIVVDLVPDQRGQAVVKLIGANAELIAARRALMIYARLRRERPTSNSVLQVQAAVAAAFKIDLPLMLSRSRRQGPTRVRQIAMMLASHVTACTRGAVARRFNRNHSTVIHAEKKFAGMLDGAVSQIGGAQ